MGMTFNWEPAVHESLEALLDAGGPGVVCFDADGTLWSGDCVVEFINETAGKLPASHSPGFEANLQDVLGAIDYNSARLQHALFSGLELSLAAAWAQESFVKRIAPTCYEPMRALIGQFDASGFEVWVCSGSPNWLVEPGAAHMGVDRARVLASQPAIVDGILGADPLVVTVGKGKAEIITRRVGPSLTFAGGDSMSDFEMLLLAKTRLVMAPPDPERRLGGLATEALRRGWLVQPLNSRLRTG